MYYVMRYDRDLTDAAMSREAPVIPGGGDFEFDNGTRITRTVPVFEFVLDADGQGRLTDLLWTTLPITLSARFKQALDGAGVANVDYFPVRVVNRISGEVHGDYFQANILGVVDCLDEKNSRIQYFSPPLPGRPPSILEIRHMVVDEGRIGGRLLFRMDRPRSICLAHEKVKEAVERAALTGVVFVPADGYAYP